MNVFSDLFGWLAGLDRAFLFLLALPFLVAFAGLAATLMRGRRDAAPPPKLRKRAADRR